MGTICKYKEGPLRRSKQISRGALGQRDLKSYTKCFNILVIWIYLHMLHNEQFAYTNRLVEIRIMAHDPLIPSQVSKFSSREGQRRVSGLTFHFQNPMKDKPVKICFTPLITRELQVWNGDKITLPTTWMVIICLISFIGHGFFTVCSFLPYG